MGTVGISLLDLVSELVKLTSQSPLFPHESIGRFIDAYEELYFYEREKNLAPRFSLATQPLADHLIQH